MTANEKKLEQADFIGFTVIPFIACCFIACYWVGMRFKRKWYYFQYISTEIWIFCDFLGYLNVEAPHFREIFYNVVESK